MSGTSAVVREMDHAGSAEEDRGVGQQAPVAAPPQRLRAHHGSDSLGGFHQQLGQRHPELLALHVVRVAAKGGVAQTGVAALWHGMPPATEAGLPAIGDAGLGNPALHGLAIEVGHSPAPWRGAHVYQIGDLGCPEQLDEALGGKPAVTDGQQLHGVRGTIGHRLR